MYRLFELFKVLDVYGIDVIRCYFRFREVIFDKGIFYGNIWSVGLNEVQKQLEGDLLNKEVIFFFFRVFIRVGE